MSIIRRSYYGNDPLVDRYNNYSWQNHHFPSSMTPHRTASPPSSPPPLALPPPPPPPPPPVHPAPLSVEKTSHRTTETVEWKETPTMHVFKVDMQGMKKEDVRLEVENGRVLKIIGEEVFEKEDKTGEYFYVERSRGTFIRSLVLPADARPHQAEACMENGVLIIKIPKEIKSSRPDVARIRLF